MPGSWNWNPGYGWLRLGREGGQLLDVDGFWVALAQSAGPQKSEDPKK